MEISSIYNDHMILQANMPCRINGRCAPDCHDLKATLIKDADGSQRVFCGKNINGEFEIRLDSTGYGGPYTLTISGKNEETITYKDVLFGEVFVMGGQSNMGWSMSQCYDGTTEKLLYREIIDNSENDMVRHMQVWPTESDVPVRYLEICNFWAPANKENVINWSAVAYFFAQRLQALCTVPVGVIVACMGATPIGAWVPGATWYNGVVAPVSKYTSRGVCWYQGEGDPVNYGIRLAELIGQWRREFENPELYWAAVELPRYVDWQSWGLSRDEVHKVKEMVSGYTYCVTLDTGLYPEWNADGDNMNEGGIHPYQKKEVGERLADAVYKEFFGGKGLLTSPLAVKIDRKEPDIVEIEFENVGAGLCLQGINGFEVTENGSDYYDAAPQLISTNRIALTCEKIGIVKRVRYGYINKRGEGINSCSDSVCVYNTEDGKTPAYPAEQFILDCE